MNPGARNFCESQSDENGFVAHSALGPIQADVACAFLPPVGQ